MLGVQILAKKAAILAIKQPHHDALKVVVKVSDTGPAGVWTVIVVVTVQGAAAFKNSGLNALNSAGEYDFPSIV